MSTKKKTSKKEVSRSDTIKVDGRTITRTKYRDELLDQLKASTNAGDCKSIRNKLRTKCGHRGGLRTRTWTDTGGDKHHVDRVPSKAVAKTTKKKTAKKSKAS